jgi:IclR family transcriptional regulator, mhp operon transcriptional activator
MVPAGDHLEIRESSRVRTPFETCFLQDRITPVNWMLSAVGRAYLAYCPKPECQKLLALLRRSDKPENRLARDTRRVDRILAEARAKGYGTRDPSFVGGAYGRQAPEDWRASPCHLRTVRASTA